MGKFNEKKTHNMAVRIKTYYHQDTVKLNIVQ